MTLISDHSIIRDRDANGTAHETITWTLPADYALDGMKCLLAYMLTLRADSVPVQVRVRLNGETVFRGDYRHSRCHTTYQIVDCGLLQPGENVLHFDLRGKGSLVAVVSDLVLAPLAG